MFGKRDSSAAPKVEAPPPPVDAKIVELRPEPKPAAAAKRPNRRYR